MYAAWPLGHSKGEGTGVINEITIVYITLALYYMEGLGGKKSGFYTLLYSFQMVRDDFLKKIP